MEADYAGRVYRVSHVVDGEFVDLLWTCCGESTSSTTILPFDRSALHTISPARKN